MIVDLSPRELKFARLAAEEREAARNRDGHHHIAGWTCENDASGDTMHTFGAIGELVVAKVLGLYWSGPTEDLGAPDVGVAEDKIEVRTTMSSAGPLIIRPHDPDDCTYYLVAPTDQPDKFNLVGWMLAGEAKKHPEWLESPKGRPAAFFVPQWELNPPVPRWIPKGYDPTVASFPTPAKPKEVSIDFLAQFSVKNGRGGGI